MRAAKMVWPKMTRKCENLKVRNLHELMILNSLKLNFFSFSILSWVRSYKLVLLKDIKIWLIWNFISINGPFYFLMTSSFDPTWPDMTMNLSINFKWPPRPELGVLKCPSIVLVRSPVPRIFGTAILDMTITTFICKKSIENHSLLIFYLSIVPDQL